MFLRKDRAKQKEANRRLEDQLGPGESVIAPDTKVKGTVSGCFSLRIAGHIDGEVDIDGLVWIEKTGKIDGTVKARGLIIEGEIRGDVESSEKTEVRSQGRVSGDITCANIAVADGCFLQGQIKMTGKSAQLHAFSKKRKSEMDKKSGLNPFRRKG